MNIPPPPPPPQILFTIDRLQAVSDSLTAAALGSFASGDDRVDIEQTDSDHPPDGVSSPVTSPLSPPSPPSPPGGRCGRLEDIAGFSLDGRRIKVTSPLEGIDHPLLSVAYVCTDMGNS